MRFTNAARRRKTAQGVRASRISSRCSASTTLTRRGRENFYARIQRLCLTKDPGGYRAKSGWRCGLVIYENGKLLQAATRGETWATISRKISERSARCLSGCAMARRNSRSARRSLHGQERLRKLNDERKEARPPLFATLQRRGRFSNSIRDQEAPARHCFLRDRRDRRSGCRSSLGNFRLVQKGWPAHERALVAGQVSGRNPERDSRTRPIATQFCLSD